MHKKVGFFKAPIGSAGGFVYVVAFSHWVKMIPFVRTAEELFETTAMRVSTSRKLSVVIHGPTYDLSLPGIIDVGFGNDPIPASETIQQGKIIYKKILIAGKNSNMAYIANSPTKTPKYEFGRGFAPTNVEAAVGNMGPLIINKLPFGTTNVYTPSQPAAVLTDEPDKKYQPFLIQRSNKRFSDMIGKHDSSGKVIIGHSVEWSRILILFQPHGSLGISMTGIRDQMIEVGLDSAVYLDGSSSVMLMLNNEFIARAASNKNETTVTGIGFKY